MGTGLMGTGDDILFDKLFFFSLRVRVWVFPYIFFFFFRLNITKIWVIFYG